MTKDLDYYMNLKYRLEITPLSDVDGGGYYAHYPELGPYVGHGDGPTVAEAIAEADISKKLFFESCLEDGDAIPEPNDARTYSGNLNLKVAKDLHKNLAEEAKRQGVSLDAYAVTLLENRLR